MSNVEDWAHFLYQDKIFTERVFAVKKCFAVMACILMMAGYAYGEYYDEGNDGDSWETAYIIDPVEDLELMSNRV